MDKKILVTGGAGFLGSHVCERLGFSKDISLNFVAPRSKEYDLRNSTDTQVLFSDFEPNVVIHLAATCGGIQANQRNPGRYFYDNMLMGMNIIEQSRLHNVDKFIFVSTVCSYPKHCKVPFMEYDIWKGYPEETNAPYGIAKKSLQVMLDAYNKEYGLKSITLIPANLYGPNDNFDEEKSHVIPALIKKIYSAKKNKENIIKVWGDGSATREFLYVKDAAEAIRLSIDIDYDSDYVNLGTGTDISIKDLVLLLCELMEYDGEIVWDYSKPNGQPKRQLAVHKVKSLLGWQSKTTLEQGLKETIGWYERHNPLY